MTGKDKDPFEHLSHLATPQPEQAKIDAVAAMSARAFAAQLAQPSAKKGHWSSRLTKGGNWLMPASAVALTVLAVALIVPVLVRQEVMPSSGGDTMLSRGPAAIAEAEPHRVEPDGTAPDAGIRMGAAPLRAPGPELSHDAVEVQTYTFDDIEIRVSSVGDEVVLYTVEGSAERQFDRRAKEPAQNIVVTDAFRRAAPEEEILFVRSGPEGGALQWDAFVDSGPGYVLSGALSGLVHDAADRDEVLARLANAAL